MSYFIRVYDWSLYSLPPGLLESNLIESDHPGNPAGATYTSSDAIWINQDFVFNGGSATQIIVDDNDGYLTDTHSDASGVLTLVRGVTINGTTYLAGSVIENEFTLIDNVGAQVWVIRINGKNVGFIYPNGSEPAPAETFTPSQGQDAAPKEETNAERSSVSYKEINARKGSLIGTEGSERVSEEACFRLHERSTKVFGAGLLDHDAAAGRLMTGSSPKGATVSSVM